MPEGIELERKALKKLAARAAGLHSEQPRTNVAQLRVIGMEADVFALPVDLSQQATLQDLTPGSPTFGQFYFLPGYDVPGDPTKIIR